MNTTELMNLWPKAMDFLSLWAPRLFAAFLIILVAIILAKVIKWAVVAAVSKIPLFANRSDGEQNVSHQIGEAVYWLIILFALPPTLDALQLTVISTPINGLIAQITGYLPNLLGAGIIFFIGLLVANIAKRTVTAVLSAANLGPFAGRFGLGDAKALPALLGGLVSVLIIIPTAIAALQTLKIEAISAPAVSVLSSVMAMLPKVIGAAVVLGIALFVAKLAKKGTEHGLATMGVNNLGKEAGSLMPAFASPLSQLGGNLVYAAIAFFGLIEAAKIIDLALLSLALTTVLDFGSKVFVGGMIILAGIMLARFVAAQVSSGKDTTSSRLVQSALIIFSAAIGLRFMGLASDIVTIAFGALIGAVAIAAAIAFGLGGRDAAGKAMAKWLDVRGK